MRLFEKETIGNLELKNRFVMAPMTRSRAIGNLANELIAKYYEQRSGAGLIITEATAVSPNGLGYARIPGVYNVEQAHAWRQVTDAVHARGGKIFVQLFHTGRIGHRANLPPGGRVVGPSAIPAQGEVWTDQHGNQPMPIPHAMTLGDVELAIEEFATAAKLAVTVGGFDGVEIHAANGYLIEQFLNPGSNQRGDIYGKDKTEFGVRVAQAIASAIGGERTGIRISPYGSFNDMAQFEKTDELFAHFANRLSKIGLAYIHVIDHGKGEVKRLVRENFKGKYILSQGYDIPRAEADLNEGRGDLVAFGKPFIANPDFVERTRQGLALSEMDASKLYTAGADGYVDYAPAKVTA